LSKISGRLSLPQPVKSRVVLELAADLEDLFEHFTAEGLPEDEAMTRAVERVQLSDEALARLIQVHGSPVSRLLERMSERTRTLWERLMLFLIALFLVAVIGREMLSASFFSDASRFLWPVAVLAMTGLVVALWKVYGLFLKHDHRVRRLRAGLGTLLALTVLTVLGTLFGVLVEMHQAALSVDNTARSLATESIMCVARIAPMIVFSLAAAVVLAVAWFALSSRVGRIEQAEASMLLDGGRQ
jgi:hypothetical protein